MKRRAAGDDGNKMTLSGDGVEDRLERLIGRGLCQGQLTLHSNSIFWLR